MLLSFFHTLSTNTKKKKREVTVKTKKIPMSLSAREINRNKTSSHLG